MRRTRKWAFVQQEAERLAGLGLTAAEIARRLDLNKSTVGRWIAAGKLTVRERREEVATGSGRDRQTPAQWAESVRREYDLDSTDDQLLTLAEEALALSMDRTVGPHIRMAASGRFQAIVRQLALVARGAQKEADEGAPKQEEPAQPKKNPPVERPPGDPRGVLMMVAK